MKEGKRSTKKRKIVLFNSKYLDLKHNLFLFSSLSWQILLDRHLPPVPPVPGASPDSSPVPPTPSSTLQCPRRTRTGNLPSWQAELLPLSHWDFHTNIAFFCAFVFLSCQNQISQAKTQFSEHRATRAVSRLLSDPFVLDLCLFWGGAFMFTGFLELLFLYERAFGNQSAKVLDRSRAHTLEMLRLLNI